MKHLILVLLLFPTLTFAAGNDCPAKAPHKYVVSFAAYGPLATPSLDAIVQLCRAQRVYDRNWDRLGDELKADYKFREVVVTNVVPVNG